MGNGESSHRTRVPLLRAQVPYPPVEPGYRSQVAAVPVSNTTPRARSRTRPYLSGRAVRDRLGNAWRPRGRAAIEPETGPERGPPRVPHEWWNSSEQEEVCFRVGIRPGLDVEIVLETVLGLMQDGKTIGSIPMNPLQLAVLVREIGVWAYSPRLSAPARKALFAPVVLLALVGRLLGYRIRYPGYSGPEANP